MAWLMFKVIVIWPAYHSMVIIIWEHDWAKSLIDIWLWRSLKSYSLGKDSAFVSSSQWWQPISVLHPIAHLSKANHQTEANRAIDRGFGRISCLVYTFTLSSHNTIHAHYIIHSLSNRTLKPTGFCWLQSIIVVANRWWSGEHAASQVWHESTRIGVNITFL